ncbi:hypothetical protein [Phenylobacterium sp.]|uniref:hypothetical protein n=1 Tax=Phenylobacterium sp. TaxID=1871053 RepID=UPI00286B08ED|nr:hypothetical protein [Phenylobacterium sp.]
MKRNTSWLSLSLSTWQMTMEAQQVIGLRMAKLAFGGEAAAAETALMFSEKAASALTLQSDMAMALMSGTGHLTPARAVTHYRRKIRANRRRLTR